MEVQVFYSLMDNRHWGNTGQGGFVGGGGETLEYLAWDAHYLAFLGLR